MTAASKAPAGVSCFLADMPGASAECSGRLVRCHVIPKSVMRRELWPSSERLRARKQGRVEQFGGTWPSSLVALIWDPRTWVWGCGGPMGNGGHHAELDHSRTLRIPRYRIPVEVESFAQEFGLVWWLDREYGAVGD